MRSCVPCLCISQDDAKVRRRNRKKEYMRGRRREQKDQDKQWEEKVRGFWLQIISDELFPYQRDR